MAESRAAGPGNRTALYSVESPRRSLAPDPDPAGCKRPPHILSVCVCVHACVCASGFLLHWSPRTLTNQLAVTELSMKCSGSDEIRQPVLLAFANPQRGFEVLQCSALTCCSKPRSILPGWQRVIWLCRSRALDCVQAPLSRNHRGLNHYCSSQFCFDIHTFGGGWIFCTAVWVAEFTQITTNQSVLTLKYGFSEGFQHDHTWLKGSLTLAWDQVSGVWDSGRTSQFQNK